MKVMDRIGNELSEGSVLYFAPLQSLVVLLHVEQPGKITDDPGYITLAMKIPVPKEKGKTEIVFPDLLRVHTPDEAAQSESVLDRALANIREGKKLSVAGGK